MKIYYNVDNEIDQNCLNKCPFENVGLNGETGKSCYVGSCACKECEYCYGHSKKGFVGLPDIKNKIRFQENSYIKCMFMYNNRFKYKPIK